jgi:carboxyl-terminal processing protease
VVEDQSLRVRSEGNAQAVVRALARRLADWREVLQDPKAQAIDFNALANWVKREVVEPERREEYAAAAISGYLAVADAHANLLPARELPGTGGARPAQGSEREQGLAVEGPVYTGIGAAVQPMVDAALVTSILRGAPAADAGLRVDDFILEIDGASTAGVPVEALVSRLRGTRGSRVGLRVKRQDRVLDLSVTRDSVSVANVVSQSLNDRGWQLAYLKIDSFLPPDTCRDFTRELERQLRPTLNGILLDLRDNAGGLIDQAVCIADLFLGADQVVLEARSLEDPAKTESVRTRRPARARMPMVTLVNARTGSASEVLAGALQDHGRSLVVGELTFGKGTVQTVRPWRGSRSVLELYTASRYDRPSGVGVQLKGIEPDIEALDQPGPPDPDRVVLREGDLFPTALPQEPETWRHPNPELVQRLRRCTRGQGLAEHRLDRERKQGQAGDYQLAVGQDALVCSLTERR